MGVCLNARNQFSAGDREAVPVGSRVSLAHGIGGGELPHAVGFSSGKEEGSRRAIYAVASGVEQRRAGELRTSDLGWDQDPGASQWQELSSGEDAAGASATSTAASERTGGRGEWRGEPTGGESARAGATRKARAIGTGVEGTGKGARTEEGGRGQEGSPGE